jgi:hypothetical protein
MAGDSVQAALTTLGAGQADVRGVLQEHGQILTAVAGEIQQCRTTLQAGAGTLAETGKQTLAALTALAAGQTAVEETVRHVKEEVAGVEARQTALHEAWRTREEAVRAALAAVNVGREQLIGSLRGLYDSVQAIAGATADTARQQATASGGRTDRPRRAANGVVALRRRPRATGERGPAAADQCGPRAQARLDGYAAPWRQGIPVARRPGHHARGAIGARLARTRTTSFWDNQMIGNRRSNARPGRFKVTAEIAAVADSRFEAVLADQTPRAARNTGDYGRFQPVEVGVAELPGRQAAGGATGPRGWQPMNLKSLDLTRPGLRT